MKLSSVFTRHGKWSFLLAPVLLAGCAAPQTETATEAESAAPAFQSAVSINEVMVSVIDHNSHILWDAVLDEFRPKTDADWHELEHAATTVAASGNIILIPCCGPNDAAWVKDPDWQKYTQQQTDAALRLLEAVKAHNMDELEMAGNALVEPCESCHRQFKPDLPGIVATPAEQPQHFYGSGARK